MSSELLPILSEKVDLAMARGSNARRLIPPHIDNLMSAMRKGIKDESFPILLYVTTEEVMAAQRAVVDRNPYPFTILVFLVLQSVVQC